MDTLLKDSPVAVPRPPVAPLVAPVQGMYVPPPPPQHGLHDKPDAVDHVLEEQRRKDAVKQAEHDMKQMKGFVRVHKCGRCGKRLKAALDGDGRAQYGTCPYCKQGTVPQESVHYAGSDSTRTNPHIKLNDTRFTEGATGTGGFQTRFSPRR